MNERIEQSIEAGEKRKKKGTNSIVAREQNRAEQKVRK